MRKTTVCMACNWAMAAVGVVAVAVGVGSMFLPPQSAHWAPAGDHPLPASALSVATSNSSETSVEGSQPRSVQTDFTAASIAGPSMKLDGQPVSQPMWPHSADEGLIYGVPGPLPPNVIPVSRLRPGLGDF